MRKGILIGLTLLLSGCAWFRDPPRQDVTTGATIVYSGSKGTDVFSICDRGNLVYLTRENPQVAIVQDGCNPQRQMDTAAQVAAWRALAERKAEVPTQPEPKAQAAPPPFTVPQPFLVQLVPVTPTGDSRAAAGEPVIVQIQPQASGPPQVYMIEPPVCHACPVAPPALQSRVGPPAPAAKVKVVQAVDPNSASLEDLERLPGVTAKTANAIVKGRPYRTPRELVDKRALTEAEGKALAPYWVIR